MTADSNEASAHNDRGRVLAGQKQLDQAIEEFRKADELWRKDQSKECKRALHNWAVILRLQKHYERATEKFREVIGIDPEDPEAYNVLGAVLADQLCLDEAIEQYRKADELWRKVRSKDRKIALCGWADALRLQKRYEQAAEKYREAIGIDPEFPNSYNGLGLVLADQELFVQAIEQYLKADELWRKTDSKDRKNALYNWARALRLQKRYEQAATKYREAIGIDLEHPDAYNGLGLSLAAQERFDEAIEEYRKADELWQKNESKDRKVALHNWAVILRLQKHYEQATEKFREAIGIDPEYPDAYNGLGAVLADQGCLDEAIEQYRKADELWRKSE